MRKSILEQLKKNSGVYETRNYHYEMDNKGNVKRIAMFWTKSLAMYDESANLWEEVK